MDVDALVSVVLRLRDAGATRVKVEGVEVEFSPPPPPVPKPAAREVVDDETLLDRAALPGERARHRRGQQ